MMVAYAYSYDSVLAVRSVSNRFYLVQFRWAWRHTSHITIMASPNTTTNVDDMAGPNESTNTDVHPAVPSTAAESSFLIRKDVVTAAIHRCALRHVHIKLWPKHLSAVHLFDHQPKCSALNATLS